MNPFLGVFLHALGGFGAGSFYIPFKGVRNWAWESYWLVGGLFIWIVAPWIVASITIPDLLGVLRDAPVHNMLWTFLFGLGWGIGNLTFGLSLRYLGMSLGMALSLGGCAFFGTILPPIFDGSFGGLLETTSGLTTLGGLAVCLFGIGLCGWAGISKERELPEETKKATIREFNFMKGAWVALFAGVMSACFAFGMAVGEPIADLALQRGTQMYWVNGAPMLLIFTGGAAVNIAWCVALNVRNGTGRDYINKAQAPLLNNYLFCMLAGLTAYSEFMFFGMGETQMGQYGFSSWTIHMAFIIVFSNMWGLIFHEWRGTSRSTKRLIIAGILVLIGSTLVSGYGNYLALL